MTDRYFSFHNKIKKEFGQRVDRISLNAGFTCPNVDGTKSKSGCIFCQDASYQGLSYEPGLSLKDQYQRARDHLYKRYGSSLYFAYFQNGSNTYAPLDILKKNYQEVLSFSDIVGLFISTRPDCLGKDVLRLLEELNHRTYLWVELGVQSHQEERLQALNRAHSVKDFEDAVKNLQERKIKVCAHVMLGLPGQTREEVCQEAFYFSQQPLQGIKIHNLVVFKGTVLAAQYDKGEYVPLSLEDYSAWCVDFLENLRPDILIHRFNAHGPKSLTVAPEWSVNKWATINAIHDELVRRDTWQGKVWQKLPLMVV